MNIIQQFLHFFISTPLALMLTVVIPGAVFAVMLCILRTINSGHIAFNDTIRAQWKEQRKREKNNREMNDSQRKIDEAQGRRHHPSIVMSRSTLPFTYKKEVLIIALKDHVIMSSYAGIGALIVCIIVMPLVF